jgi:antitoxin component YwqK of YwqJK toxin-antitoxin module
MAQEKKQKTAPGTINLRKIDWTKFKAESHTRLVRTKHDGSKDVLEFKEANKVNATNCINKCPWFSQYDADGQLHGFVLIFGYSDVSECVYKTHYNHGTRDADIIIIKQDQKIVKSIPNDFGLVEVREYCNEILVKEYFVDDDGKLQGSFKTFDDKGCLVQKSFFKNDLKVLLEEYESGSGQVIYRYNYDIVTENTLEQKLIDGSLKKIKERKDGVEYSYFETPPYCLQSSYSRTPWDIKKFFNRYPSGKILMSHSSDEGYKEFYRDSGGLKFWAFPAKLSENRTETYYDNKGNVVKRLEIKNYLLESIDGQVPTINQIIENDNLYIGEFFKKLQGKSKGRQK